MLCHHVGCTHQMCESESPSSLERSNKSLALSPDMVNSFSPTADLNKVSNLAWSAAVMNARRMLGILLAFGAVVVVVGVGAAVLEDRKEAAIWLKPVGWGFMGAAGRVAVVDWCGVREKPVG